jgi:ketosteroid isomerase-like protein
MIRLHPLTLVAVACVAISLSACGSGSTATQAASANDASSAIPVALMASADAWNNADLAGHIRPYADSATFMGNNGPIQGRERVDVRPLGDRHALVTGQFLLSGGGEADRSGWFSLTWEKTEGGWKILHDHSS